MNTALAQRERDSVVSGFATLAAGLGWKPKEVVAVLWGYFDESGTLDKGQVRMTIGGLIAPLHRWQAFEWEWKDALDRNGLGAFHARTLSHGMIAQFAQIIPRKGFVALGWTQSGGNTSEAYEKAFVDCLLEAANVSAVTDGLRVVFAAHPEFREKRAERFYNIIIGDVGVRLKGFDVEEPKDVWPLQVADLVSHSLSGGKLELLEGFKMFLWVNGARAE